MLLHVLRVVHDSNSCFAGRNATTSIQCTVLVASPQLKLQTQLVVLVFWTVWSIKSEFDRLLVSLHDNDTYSFEMTWCSDSPCSKIYHGVSFFGWLFLWNIDQHPRSLQFPFPWSLSSLVGYHDFFRFWYPCLHLPSNAVATMPTGLGKLTFILQKGCNL